MRAAVAADDDETGEPVAQVALPTLVDGEAVPLSEKELGAVELFPQNVLHNANGRFVAVCGDSEYVIYTSQALRNKSFGTALDFVWSSGGVGDYAVRESTSRIKISRNFKETSVFKPVISAEGLSGGALLGVRSADAICFYEWETARMLRRIEVAAKCITWNDSGELVAITSDEAFFVLRFKREEVVAGVADGEEGIEAAFELQHEVTDKAQAGVWVGDCYVYTNAANRLNYYVGGEVITLAHLDRRMYVLGYLAKEGRVFLIDKAGTVTSYGLCLAVLEYQTVVVRRDFAAANRILPEVPREHLNAVAKFLEGQGFKEQALTVAIDPDIRFDLSVQLGKLDMARVMLKSAAAAAAGSTDADSAELQVKWKQLLDLALATSNLDLAEECALAAHDLGALLLIYSSIGDQSGLLHLGALAEEVGKDNIAFLAYHAAGSVDGCARALAASGQTFESEVYSTVFAGSVAKSLKPLPSSLQDSSLASLEDAPQTAAESEETAPESEDSLESASITEPKTTEPGTALESATESAIEKTEEAATLETATAELEAELDAIVE